MNSSASNQSSAWDAIVVGGGFSGLAAAYDLSKSGLKTLVLEKDADLGGLGGTFEILPGIRIEKFYHHWFNSDRAILSLIDELGLSSSVRVLASRTGLYYANSQFRLATPFDLLRFTPLPLIDRIRTGLLALRARSVADWRALESLTAEEWLTTWGGRRGYEVIWKPLLKGKFGPEAPHVGAVWFWNKLKLRGGSRGKGGKEELLYFEGGFQRVTDAVADAIRANGSAIQTRSGVAAIRSHEGRVQGVTLEDGRKVDARRVLVTVPLPVYLPMVPELAEHYRETAAKIRFLGNVCLVLRMSRSLSDTYWLNVADPSFPFVGIIEHTNFDSPENFRGEHIAYLSKYLPTSEALYHMTEKEVFEYALPYIQKMFPDFSRDWVNGYSVWRAPYSQPVVTKHYSTLIPPVRTPIRDLWLCSMAQVYPEDRGTNYAVAFGRRAAREIIDERRE